jgi:hypothetical protein
MKVVFFLNFTFPRFNGNILFVKILTFPHQRTKMPGKYSQGAPAAVNIGLPLPSLRKKGLRQRDNSTIKALNIRERRSKDRFPFPERLADRMRLFQLEAEGAVF